jgi:hypothetical protein
LHPFERIGGGDGWGWGVHIRRWSSFDIDGVLLTHLLFFIGVAAVIIIRQPKKPAVEVVKKSSGELLIPQSVREAILLVRRKIHHRDLLRGTTVFLHE